MTAEQAAEDYMRTLITGFPTDNYYQNMICLPIKEFFIAGATWQEGQMYSREEVIALLNEADVEISHAMMYDLLRFDLQKFIREKLKK